MAGRAWGKTIFFGEHFVVYGLPAIVAAINNYIEVNVEKSKKFEIIDNAPRFPGVPILTVEMCEKPLRAVMLHLKKEYSEFIDDNFKITFSGTLPIPHGGIGSSAALFVAFARAINEMYQLNLSEQKISEAALEGEKLIHGNPSGIDTTAATLGGTFLFEQGQVMPIALKEQIDIVLIDSGKKTDTKKVIEGLGELKKRKPEFVTKIFDEYKKLIEKANIAFINYNLEEIGSLMNENHKLLQELTLSCDELDDAIKIARNAGALGAKLTGTGRGGLALALTPNNQNEVAAALEKAGYAVLKTTILPVVPGTF